MYFFQMIGRVVQLRFMTEWVRNRFPYLMFFIYLKNTYLSTSKRDGGVDKLMLM